MEAICGHSEKRFHGLRLIHKSFAFLFALVIPDEKARQRGTAKSHFLKLNPTKPPTKRAQIINTRLLTFSKRLFRLSSCL